MTGLAQGLISFPEHPSTITPTQARTFACLLADLADEAEGEANPEGFVRRRAVLQELSELRAKVAALSEERQDYWTAQRSGS